MHRRTVHACLLPLTLFLVSTAWQTAAAQQPAASMPKVADSPEQEPFTLSTTTRSVLTDILVTDAFGHPVVGLKQSDFTVAEDGVAQKIQSFEAHSMDSLPIKAPANLPVNTFVNLSNEPERGPLYVLIYDMVNTPVEDQPFARTQLVKFVNNKPEGTRFMVVAMSDGMYLMQGFTTDKKLIADALDIHGKREHMPKIFLMGRNFGAGNISLTTEMLRQLIQFLHGLPGRKNLIWVSTNFPVPLLQPVATAVVGTAAGASGGSSMGVGAIAGGEGDATDDAKVLLEVMAGEEISLFPVGASGVSLQSDAGTYMNPQAIADATGGHAYLGTNDLAEALDKAVGDGASYYTITYSPTNKNYNGAARDIKIKVDRKGVSLSYRSSYHAFNLENDEIVNRMIEQERKRNNPGSPAKPVAAAPVEKIEDKLALYMEHGMPMAHGILFQVHLRAVGKPKLATDKQLAELSQEPAFFVHRGASKAEQAARKWQPAIFLQQYAIEYAVPTRQFLSPGASASAEPQASLEFAGAAFRSDGGMLNGVINNLDIGGARNPVKGRSVMTDQQFYVPTNTVYIRLAVRDTSTGRLGALEVTLPLAPES